MTHEDPLIDTGIEQVRVSKARFYFKSELGRTPTINKPRDTAMLLSILRAFPTIVQKYSALEVLEDFKTDPHFYESETAQTIVREARMIAYTPYGEETSVFICFGDLSRNEMGQQCQYGSRYVNSGMDDYPNLAEGLRIEGDPLNHHSLRIHVDDVPTFMKRYREHREARKRA